MPPVGWACADLQSGPFNGDGNLLRLCYSGRRVGRQFKEIPPRLFGHKLRRRREFVSGGETVRPGPIPVASANVIFLQAFAYELHFDGAPSAIGIGLWVVAKRV